MPFSAIQALLRTVLVAMTSLSLAACASAPAAPLAVSADTAPVAVAPAPEPDATEIAAVGERLFLERCSTCHEAGRAPPRSQIATNSPQQILEALDTGFMAPIAMFMSVREKTILARHLSGVAD
jgi:mono/diheme cytochrome c family protein